jgi:hypothetical protein
MLCYAETPVLSNNEPNPAPSSSATVAGFTPWDWGGTSKRVPPRGAHTGRREQDFRLNLRIHYRHLQHDPPTSPIATPILPRQCRIATFEVTMEHH